MTLIDAPAYDPRRDILKRNILIGAGVFIVLAIALGMGGYVLGHGWFFSNLPAEHKVDHFLGALEAKDYQTAYNIYINGHPDSGYPISRFTTSFITPAIMTHRQGPIPGYANRTSEHCGWQVAYA